jgi:hypothetical protein
LGLDECGKLFDGFLSPFGGSQSLADIFANAPIQLDEFLVAGRNDAILSSFDKGKDFGELGLQFIYHWSPTS